LARLKAQGAVFRGALKSSLSAFIGDLPLAAHNAAFDMGVLRAALEWYKLPIPPLKYFCTLKLSRAAWPEMESHALTSLWENISALAMTPTTRWTLMSPGSSRTRQLNPEGGGSENNSPNTEHCPLRSSALKVCF
jgi:hypothetical protein